MSIMQEEGIKPLSNNDFKKLLVQQKQESGHKRQQKLLNALTSVGSTMVYIIPTILVLLYSAVLTHKAWSGEWDILEDTLKSLLIPVTTYLAGMLSKTVLPTRNDE
jgi:hypothetical protein